MSTLFRYFSIAIVISACFPGCSSSGSCKKACTKIAQCMKSDDSQWTCSLSAECSVKESCYARCINSASCDAITAVDQEASRALVDCQTACESQQSDAGGAEIDGHLGDPDRGVTLPIDANIPPSSDADLVEGPRFLSFGTNVTALTAGEQVVFSAVLTDPDGISDLIGGTLTSADGLIKYAAFATSGQEGAYSASLSWEMINQSLPIGFATEEMRTFVAEFYDEAGHRTAQSATIRLHCGGAPATNGICTGCATPGESLCESQESLKHCEGGVWITESCESLCLDAGFDYSPGCGNTTAGKCDCGSFVGFGGICDLLRQCKPDLFCGKFGTAGSEGFCTKYCTNYEGACTGAPAGTTATCIGDLGSSYACLFECSSTLCPDGMSCDVDLCKP